MRNKSNCFVTFIAPSPSLNLIYTLQRKIYSSEQKDDKFLNFIAPSKCSGLAFPGRASTFASNEPASAKSTLSRQLAKFFRESFSELLCKL